MDHFSYPNFTLLNISTSPHLEGCFSRIQTLQQKAFLYQLFLEAFRGSSFIKDRS